MRAKDITLILTYGSHALNLQFKCPRSRHSCRDYLGAVSLGRVRPMTTRPFASLYCGLWRLGPTWDLDDKGSLVCSNLSRRGIVFANGPSETDVSPRQLSWPLRKKIKKKRRHIWDDECLLLWGHACNVLPEHMGRVRAEQLSARPPASNWGEFCGDKKLGAILQFPLLVLCCGCWELD